MHQRDLKLLSSYLDGQLKPSDSARLERRLSSDPDLRAVLDDLRSARGLLRQLPMRKAPRNFTLTPKMVGKNPPLPRAYPTFKFVTALATLLLFFTMGINFMAVQMAAPASSAFGMGGGGAPEINSAEAPAAAQEAATEAPLDEPSAEMLPLPTSTPSSELAPSLTVIPPSEDNARTAETPLEKKGVVTGAAEGQNRLAVPNGMSPQPVSQVWQIVLAGIALLGVLIMILMRRLAAERWRGK